MTGGDDPTPRLLQHEPIWERQPDESPEAWDAFTNARDHDDRGLTATSIRLDKGRSLLGTWSTRWSWQRRFEAYDRYLDALHRKNLERLRMKAAERHVRVSGLYQQVFEAPVAVLAKKLGVSQADLEAMTVKELQSFVKDSAAAYKTVVDVERLGLGAETEHVHHSGGIEVSDLRKAYAEVQAEPAAAKKEPKK